MITLYLTRDNLYNTNCTKNIEDLDIHDFLINVYTLMKVTDIIFVDNVTKQTTNLR